MFRLATINWDNLYAIWPHVTAIGHVVVATLASAHVVMRKRDSRAAIGCRAIERSLSARDGGIIDALIRDE